MRQALGAGALGRPRGIGWKGRWEGGSGWGICVNPWLIHVNVWQKPLQYCKVISLQLIKINGKKNFKKGSKPIVFFSGGRKKNQVPINCLHNFSNNFPVSVPKASYFQKFHYSRIP